MPGRDSRLPGLVALAVALAASLALSLQHLGAGALPGCGLESPCQRALSGPFGVLPWIGWPLAFLGASFFAALLAAWSLGAWSSPMRWSARLGGAGSLVLLVLAFVYGTPCPYCLCAQAANLAFVFLSERVESAARARRPEAAFVTVFLLATAALAVARRQSAAHREASEERALGESTRAIASAGTGRVFTGRYRKGPARARARLVLFTDYQCPDCARLEREAWSMVEERADVSLSIKHFPLCRDCNRRARELDHNPHPNACWAARAAEAAGALGGEEGFWRMHRWLFERGGAFRDDELRAVLPSLGYEAGAFLRAMQSPATQARVEADVDEGLALGIASTPMLFVNGVELRGWRASGAVHRAVEAAAASAPAALGAEADRPPGALEKGLEDWRAEPRVAVPPRSGEERAAGEVEVVLWSDYREPATRELDRRIRAFLAEHPGLRYSYRHYPLDPGCTPSAPDAHPGACRAARAVEAARRLAGAAAAEGLHVWLMEHDGALEEPLLRAGARAAGIDADALLAAAEEAEAAGAVRTDIEVARRLGIRSIPFLFVAGRNVPRWRIEELVLLEPILLEALGPR